MTQNLKQLQQRAVACARWRWMPGMLTAPWSARDEHTIRVTCVLHDGIAVGVTRAGGEAWTEASDVPDLTDPPTLGCLMAILRDAHGMFWLEPNETPPRGWLARSPSQILGWGDTEAEALVAALERSP